ncbi:MAG: MotA/TolQ/ExbB proton channel family protein, partial [Myxococcota bacterium]
ERKVDKTVIDIIDTGGVIAWVIVGIGILSLLMIIVRVITLLLSSRGNRGLLDPVLKYLEKGEVDRAIALASRAKNPAGRVLTATLNNLDKSREQIEDIVAEAVLQEQPHLSRFGSAILVLAAVSPLMGLLGTVTGMISTFDIITEFGTGNPKLLSGGISEALVTTELGLIVAIPSLLLGYLLSGWSDSIRDGLDGSALAVVNRAAGLKPPDDDDLEPAPAPPRGDGGDDKDGESDAEGTVEAAAEAAA